MSLETIFKFIRNEDVVIWLGAGFSSYAGFPSGTQLQKTIYSELSTEEKQQVDPSSSLRKTAGAMVTFHGNSRNELNRILIREFSKEPTSRYFHDLISHIPHFKSIITTNYDSLIEDSYDRRADVIRFGKDVPYIDSQKIKIYKPHGDLKSKDQIIITDNDYAKFYNIDYKDPFWISLLNDIIKKNILFIGYGFEDDNVWAWFDFIDKQLGVDRKQRFLISPDWPSLKKKELQTRHVSYIDSTANKFLAELNEHLKLNIIADLENGIVTQDTFNKFIDFHNLNSQILNENGKPILTSLYNSQNEVNGKLNIKLTDKYVLKHFKKFNQGFGNEIKITRD